MDTFKIILLLVCLWICTPLTICAGNAPQKKLFLFGDSFVDTSSNFASPQWKNPCKFGITFPGYVFGRQSNGRILTDYIASFLNTSCPPSDRSIMEGSVVNTTKLNGMNFAIAGSGLFKAFVKETLSDQIQQLKNFIKNKFFDKKDIENSVFIIVNSGNDVGYFIYQHNKQTDFSNITNQLLDQFILNLKDIIKLGARKIVVSGLRPLECEPINVGEPYHNCIDSMTKYILHYNNLLQQAAKSLNDDNKNARIVYMDLYTAFRTTISQRRKSGSKSYPNPLEPCCKNSLFDTPTRPITLCNDPELAFYMDDVHPTQSGWHDIFGILQSSLESVV